MSFNWPAIPFNGTEVDAFVIAYKELAESIYQEMWEEYPLEFIDGDTKPHLKIPFRNINNIKKLMEFGLLYSAFIIQQRSGTAGPGVDFTLGNSPMEKILDSSEYSYLIKKLGCIYTKEYMLRSLRNQTETAPKAPPGPGEPEDPLDPIDQDTDDWLDDLISDVEDENLDDITTPEDPNEPLGPCSPGPIAGGLLGAAKTIARNRDKMKARVLDRYANCNSTPVTETDFSDGEMDQLKRDLNTFVSRSISKGKVSQVTNISTPPQLASLVPPGGRVVALDTYNVLGNSLELYKFIGRAKAILNADDTIHMLRDDFDFVYGMEVNRTDDSFPGDPYNPSDVQPGIPYREVFGRDSNGNPVPLDSPHAIKTNGVPIEHQPYSDRSDTKQHHGGVGRGIVIDQYWKGVESGDAGGRPVPINIQFTY